MVGCGVKSDWTKTSDKAIKDLQRDQVKRAGSLGIRECELRSQGWNI